MKREVKTVTSEEIKKQYEYIDRVREINRKETSKPVAVIKTFGCQQNEADSERLAGMAEAMGYTVSEFEAEADLIVVNTCAIR